MSKVEKIHLPISTGYVNHWGFWEAIREIIQNQVDSGTGYVDNIEYDVLAIKTEAGKLDKSTLLLGESSKRDDDTKIGCYGEGYKLALLVLTRMGYKVEIYNGKDSWFPIIEEHPQLGTECLTIVIEEGVNTDLDDDEVVFEITGLCGSDFEELGIKYFKWCEDQFNVVVEEGGSQILSTEEGDYWEEGNKLYVGGIYVCDLPEDYKYSYNFAPNILDLDRDRGSVSNFELGYELVNLLVRSQNIELLIKLASEKTPDIGDYGNIYANKRVKTIKGETTVGELSKEQFFKDFGENAFPINQDDGSNRISILTDLAIKLGLKPVIVKKLYYQMLPDSLKTLPNVPKGIKSNASTVLESYLESHGKFLKARPKRYLKELITRCKIVNN